MPDGAFAVEVVTGADPILPKIDLVLGAEGLEWAEEPSSENRDPRYNELVQSILMAVLMQRGDYRYNRAKGFPWTQHPRMVQHTSIVGSDFSPYTLKAIEAAMLAELSRADHRIVSVKSVKASVTQDDLARRKLTIVCKFEVVTGEMVSVSVEARV